MKAFSIGRRRAPPSKFLGPDSDTSHAAADLLPDQSQDGLWLGFVDGGIVYLRDGQVRSSYERG